MVQTTYKQTEVGLIPEDWEIAKLEDFTIKIGSGITPTGGSTVYKDDGRPFVRSQNVGWGNLLLDDIAYIDEETHQTFPNTEIKLNDVFLNISGASIGRSSFANEKLIGGNVNQHVCIIRTIKDKLNPLFLNLFLISKNGQKQIDSFQSGGNRQGLNIGQIRTFQIPIPPTLTEQTLIATALSDADALISSLEKLIAKKRNIKQGAMQKCLNPDSYDLNDDLDLTEEEKSQKSINHKNHSSDKWEVKKLGEVCDVVGGGTPSSFIPSYWNGTINWFTPTEIGKTKYTFDSVRKISKEGFINCSGKMLPIGTILLTTRAGIGDLSILMNEGCTNQGFQSLIAKEGYYNEYLYYLMQTLKNVLIQNASGSTFLEISPNKIKQIEILMPSFSEQTRIATILSDMDAEIAVLESKLEKYRNVKLGMMQNLLTGKIRLV